MTDVDKAIAYLKEYQIDSFECSGILVIPCTSPNEIYDMATRVRRYFKEIGFDKSWQIDPYFYDKHNSLTADMFDSRGTASQ